MCGHLLTIDEIIEWTIILKHQENYFQTQNSKQIENKQQPNIMQI